MYQRMDAIVSKSGWLLRFGHAVHTASLLKLEADISDDLSVLWH